MTDTLSRRIGTHVAAVRLAQIPQTVVAAAKRSLADTLAVALAGVDAQGVEPVRSVVRADGGVPQATLWGTQERLPASAAAFANSVAAAALDWDGIDPVAVTHNDIVTVPALLAVAEREGASGAEFLAALIVANDLVSRLAAAAPGHDGWFRTSVFGVFGAAAGAARLLGLDAAGIARSLGVALSTAGGTQQPMVERALTKRVQAAWAARAGVQSALLAQAGVTAPAAALDGRFGLYALYQRGEPGQVADGLGERWHNERLSLKKYPSCAATHAAIEAALALAEDHDLQPEALVGLEVVLSPYAHRLVGAPYVPADEVAAQFSVQYAVAVALARRRFSVLDLQPAQAGDPAVVALARRVAVSVDDGLGDAMAPATVRVATRAGARLERVAAQLPGSPAQPLGAMAHAAKLRDALAAAPSALDAAALLAAVDTLDSEPSVARFAALLQSARPLPERRLR